MESVDLKEDRGHIGQDRVVQYREKSRAIATTKNDWKSPRGKRTRTRCIINTVSVEPIRQVYATCCFNEYNGVNKRKLNRKSSVSLPGWLGPPGLVHRRRRSVCRDDASEEFVDQRRDGLPDHSVNKHNNRPEEPIL